MRTLSKLGGGPAVGSGPPVGGGPAGCAFKAVTAAVVSAINASLAKLDFMISAPSCRERNSRASGFAILNALKKCSSHRHRSLLVGPLLTRILEASFLWLGWVRARPRSGRPRATVRRSTCHRYEVYRIKIACLTFGMGRRGAAGGPSDVRTVKWGTPSRPIARASCGH